MLSEGQLIAQAPLIRWFAKNGVKVPEGVPEPEALFITETTIHLNVCGLEPDGRECVVEAEAALVIDPPATLGIPQR